jgi:hypothetical protein
VPTRSTSRTLPVAHRRRSRHVCDHRSVPASRAKSTSFRQCSASVTSTTDGSHRAPRPPSSAAQAVTASR